MKKFNKRIIYLEDKYLKKFLQSKKNDTNDVPIIILLNSFIFYIWIII